MRGTAAARAPECVAGRSRGKLMPPPRPTCAAAAQSVRSKAKIDGSRHAPAKPDRTSVDEADNGDRTRDPQLGKPGEFGSTTPLSRSARQSGRQSRPYYH